MARRLPGLGGNVREEDGGTLNGASPVRGGRVSRPCTPTPESGWATPTPVRRGRWISGSYRPPWAAWARPRSRWTRPQGWWAAWCRLSGGRSDPARREAGQREERPGQPGPWRTGPRVNPEVVDGGAVSSTRGKGSSGGTVARADGAGSAGRCGAGRAGPSRSRMVRARWASDGFVAACDRRRVSALCGRGRRVGRAARRRSAPRAGARAGGQLCECHRRGRAHLRPTAHAPSRHRGPRDAGLGDDRGGSAQDRDRATGRWWRRGRRSC